MDPPRRKKSLFNHSNKHIKKDYIQRKNSAEISKEENRERRRRQNMTRQKETRQRAKRQR